MTVLAEDAADKLGLRLVDVEVAAVVVAVSVGRRPGGHPAQLGLSSLAHPGPLPEVVQLDVADGRHQAEGLHVDGVHDGRDADPVRVDDLHEGGGGVHSPAEPVGLPAHDGVEASYLGVGQHPLELRPLLRPASAHLLIACDDGHSILLAVGFHVADLLGDGGLVLLGLALVRDAGVDGRPFLLTRSTIAKFAETPVSSPNLRKPTFLSMP